MTFENLKYDKYDRYPLVWGNDILLFYGMVTNASSCAIVHRGSINTSIRVLVRSLPPMSAVEVKLVTSVCVSICWCSHIWTIRHTDTKFGTNQEEDRMLTKNSLSTYRGQSGVHGIPKYIIYLNSIMLKSWIPPKTNASIWINSMYTSSCFLCYFCIDEDSWQIIMQWL